MTQAVALDASRTRRKAAPAVAPERKGRRRLWRRIALAVLLLWLAGGYFVVRPVLRARLEAAFRGRARVAFALLLPDLSVLAFGVGVEGDGYGFSSSRVRIGLNALAVFGGRAVTRVGLANLDLAFEQGARIRPLQEPVAEGDTACGPVNLDPPRLPPIGVGALDVRVRGGGEVRTVFRAAGLDVSQIGDRNFALRFGPGRLGRIPFDKMTARVVPRAGHLMLGDLKLQAFGGILGGMLDLDLGRAGALNGELEAHLLEVEEIWRTFDLPEPAKRRGQLSGHVVFEAERPVPEALKGTGEATLSQARFSSPLSFRVLLVIGVPVAREAELNSGSFRFSFESGLVYLEQARLEARKFDLDVRGILSFDGRGDLEVRHAGTTVAVRGPLADPTIRVLPLNAVTVPFDRVFRERVDKRKR